MSNLFLALFTRVSHWKGCLYVQGLHSTGQLMLFQCICCSFNIFNLRQFWFFLCFCNFISIHCNTQKQKENKITWGKKINYNSGFIPVHCLSYTLTSKRFTLSRKNGLMIGCLSEMLDDCVCVFLYEGFLANYKICVCFWCKTWVRSCDQSRWWRRNMILKLVRNNCQNGNLCKLSYKKHKIYNLNKTE